MMILQAPLTLRSKIHHAAEDHDYVGHDHGHDHVYDDQDGDCVRNDDMSLQDLMILTTATPCEVTTPLLGFRYFLSCF